jgi:hypothetical protein
MATRAVLAGAVILFLAFPGVLQGQQQPRPSTLPDTPAPKQSEAVSPQKPEKKLWHAPLGMMVRRSFFYPDLATTPGPLTPEKKFKLFLTESISPSRLLASTAGAGINQARDWPHGYGQGSDGFAKRFGASMATGASSHAFGTFLLPSILRQDPRYFVRYNGSFGVRAKYALRRMVVTRDDSGREVFNWSGIIGPMMAESLANSYLPEHEQTVAKTFGRSGTRIGFAAANNLLKEYWPTIFKSLRINRVAPGLEPAAPASAAPGGAPPPR